jgi:DNA-binding NarL/FixJ family response regulator
MPTINSSKVPAQSFHIRVIIADDHAIVREGIAVLLKDYFKVVGLAADGVEALNMAEQLHPTVLVLDLMMPNLNGIEVVTQLPQRAPNTRAIILSMNEDEAQIAQAVKAGSMGYVLKQAGGEGLIQAIQAVALGNRYFTPTINVERVDDLLRKPTQIAPDPYDLLTVREREIVALVVEGRTSQEIAVQLSLSSRTVEVHRAHIMKKLNVENIASLIRVVMKHNGEASTI